MANIIIQFRLRKATGIPLGMPWRSRESATAFTKRRRPQTGKLAGEAQNCSLEDFSAFANLAGYVLVDAYAQERYHTNGPGTYHIVRYIFALREESATGKHDRKHIKGFNKLCRDAFWGCHVFTNGMTYPTTINLDTRRPRTNANGPVMEYQKDSEGNRVGEHALPITPDAHLIMAAGKMTFLKLTV